MEKYFITYNQAFKLKELGFDETCLAYYDGWNGQTDLIITDESPKFLTKLFNLFSKNKYSSYTQDYVEYLGGFCTAPIKSQVFEWARKEYRIISVIDFYCDNDEWEDTMYEVRISEFKHFKTHDSFVQSEYKSYEEAETACIDKLIEIIKNK